MKKGDDASNRVGWVGSGLAKVLPLGPVVTNRGWWRYPDTEILQYCNIEMLWCWAILRYHISNTIASRSVRNTLVTKYWLRLARYFEVDCRMCVQQVKIEIVDYSRREKPFPSIGRKYSWSSHNRRK